jgi:hypothetical protein
VNADRLEVLMQNIHQTNVTVDQSKIIMRRALELDSSHFDNIRNVSVNLECGVCLQEFVYPDTLPYTSHCCGWPLCLNCLDVEIKSYPVKCGSGIHNDGGTIRRDQFNIAFDLWQKLAVWGFLENGAAGGGAAGNGAAGGQ